MNKWAIVDMANWQLSKKGKESVVSMMFLLTCISSCFFAVHGNIFWMQQFQPYLFQTGSIIFFCIVLLLVRNVTTSFLTRAEMLLLAVFLYCQYNSSRSYVHMHLSEREIQAGCYFLLFIALRLCVLHASIWSTFVYILFFIAYLNIAVCLFQVFDAWEITYKPFLITGLFLNPSQLAGFLVAVVPFAVHKRRDMKPCYLIDILLAGILIVVLVAGSRAAIISAGCFLIAEVFNQLKKESKKVRAYVASACFAIIIVLACLLYIVKPNSAKGRLLIWKVAFGMVLQNPLWGNGSGYAANNYSVFQSRYFASGKGSKEEMKLARGVATIYNEPLRFIIDNGIIAFAVLTFILHRMARKTLFDGQAELRYALWTILIILIFGLFSYPSDTILINIVLLFSLVRLSSYGTPIDLRISVPRTMINPVLGVLALVLSIETSLLLHATESWRRCELNSWTDPKYQLRDYGKLFSILGTNPAFLHAYAVRLHNFNQPSNILELYSSRKQFFTNSVNLHLILGYNKQRLGRYREAEVEILLATNMAPVLLTPKLYLLKLYEETQQTKKAEAVAILIIGNDIPVHNSESRQIISYARNYLETKRKV